MMDELNHLKKIWNQVSDTKAPKLSSDELRKIVRGRSNSEVEKIRRKLRSELATTIVLSFIIVGIVYWYKPQDTIYGVILVLVSMAVSIRYYRSLFKMKFCQGEELLSYLKMFVSNFESLIAQYNQRSMFMFPFAAAGGFLLGRSIVDGNEWSAFFTTTNIIYLAVVVVIISVLGYQIQKRYFRWIYGKNIERLRNLIIELEQITPEE